MSQKTELGNCPECGKEKLFENRAGGITCGGCGLVVFSASAEEHIKLLQAFKCATDVVDAQGVQIKQLEKMVGIQETLIKKLKVGKRKR